MVTFENDKNYFVWFKISNMAQFWFSSIWNGKHYSHSTTLVCQKRVQQSQ